MTHSQINPTKVGGFLLLTLFLIGCNSVENVFNVREKVELIGDYSESEAIDFLDEKPDYIPTAKIICGKRAAQCIMIMEIDYELFYEEIKQAFSKCDMDLENIDYDNPPTPEQIECSKEVWKSLGFNLPTEVSPHSSHE